MNKKKKKMNLVRYNKDNSQRITKKQKKKKKRNGHCQLKIFRSVNCPSVQTI